MKKYHSMFIWQNNNNLTSLVNYRKLFHDYAEAYRSGDSKKLSGLRAKIMTESPAAEQALLAANIPHWMNYGSRAGGYRHMSITHELPEFVKNQFSVLGSDDDTLEKIDDMYLRAIGIYHNNVRRAWLNTLNPFMYLNALVKLILLPVFSILSIKPAKQDKGIWWILQLLLRIPAYYVTVVHPFLLIIGKEGLSSNFLNRILDLF